VSLVGLNAVECAVALRCRIADANGALPAERRIELRVGINLGDVVVEGDDLFGDGVNVAARLQEVAEPGGICVASSVRDQVRAKVALEFDDLGERQLKNIAAPVRVYRNASAAMPPPLIEKPSIAVLPFENLSGDPEQQYFPAVNLVSRLEGLAKELGRPLLYSAAFAVALDVPLASLGRFALKGVAEPEEVFAPAAPDDVPGDS
jgi:class 3 adenylate cyclase